MGTINVLSDEDSSPLAIRLWLHDEGLQYSSFSGLLEVILETNGIVREEEGPGEEVIVLWELFLQPIKVLRQCVFPVQSIHAWIMIDLLVRGHLGQEISSHCIVLPLDIPVFRLVVLKLPVELLTHFFDDIVLRVCEIHADGFVVFLIGRPGVIDPDIGELDRSAVVVEVGGGHIIVHFLDGAVANKNISKMLI